MKCIKLKDPHHKYEAGEQHWLIKFKLGEDIEKIAKEKNLCAAMRAISPKGKLLFIALVQKS